jgi:hypothetical protein
MTPNDIEFRWILPADTYSGKPYLQWRIPGYHWMNIPTVLIPMKEFEAEVSR